MENQNDNRNQIIRIDARASFVETRNDCFHLGKVHLQFVAYDKNRPSGQRATSIINIYIDVPQFLVLAQEAANGSLHMRMQQYKNERRMDPLFERLGGTSAKRLAKYGEARPDGMSLSRVFKLTIAEKADYFLTADSGPGEENKTGLIIPRFGKSPEHHVSVPLGWQKLNEMLFTTVTHYKAWLSAKYMREWNQLYAPRQADKGQKGKEQLPAASSTPNAPQSPSQSGRPAAPERPSIPQPANRAPAPANRAPAPANRAPASAPANSGFGSKYGSVYGSINGNNDADDTRIF